MSVPFHSRQFLRLGGLILSLSVLSPLVSSAQDAPKKEISEKVSEELGGKLREYTEAKQYDPALALVNSLLSTVKPESYDRTVLNQIKVQILLTQEKYAEAIAPMETALRLGKTYDFIEQRQYLEFSQILSQLYFQEATSTKDTKLRDEYLGKAYNTIKEYLANNDKPTVDSMSYAATMIYTQATIDPNNTNKKLLNEAKELAQQGLTLSIKPRETFYVLILAALQQEEKNKEASELLELLVTLNPTSKQYWQQLQATYLNLANNAKDPDEALEWNVRTIVTIERAQKLGILNGPRDYFNMVGIMMNIRQFDQAIQLLEKGLANGNIESTQQNWEYLASSYQQVHKELKAIDVLKQTAARYPEAGDLEFKIANIYYGLDKMADAYSHGKSALKKGGVENVPAVQMFIAYMGYELKKYEEALPFAEAAKNAGTTNADRLYEAIKNAIQERQEALEATI
jgi:hypothetical protein